MKAKTHLIALVLLGSVFFSTDMTTFIDLNDQTQTSVDGKKIKIPTKG